MLFEDDYVSKQGLDSIIRLKHQGGLVLKKDTTSRNLDTWTNENDDFRLLKNKKRIVVDPESMPGHEYMTNKFRYCGAHKLWFGEKINKYIPQSLITSFQGAVEIRILEGNVTYVHLYEGIYDGDDEHNQQVQDRFRKHLQIDTLIDRFPELDNGQR